LVQKKMKEIERLIVVVIVCLATCGCAGTNHHVEAISCRPGELLISGNHVFADSLTINERLSDYSVFLHIGEDDGPGSGFRFLPNQAFKGQQIRSAFPPAYDFAGTWALMSNGCLRLDGRFAGFSPEYAGHLPAEQPFSLVVSAVEHVPQWKRLKLFAGKVLDYYPYVLHAEKVTNNVPSDAVAVLAELRTSKVATPEEAASLVWQILTKEERKSMADAMSRLPSVVHLRRIADKVNDDIVARDLVWVIHMSLPDRPIVSNENERWFFIPARTGKIITPTQVPEDTARKLADPLH
jgi:hypothetical protein